MSTVTSRHVKFLDNGGTCTTIDYEDGGRATIISIPNRPLKTTQRPARQRYSPGTLGYRNAMRIIDAEFHNGVITAAEATRMEEDYVTDSDREER
jgi:hypothetical protein